MDVAQIDSTLEPHATDLSIDNLMAANPPTCPLEAQTTKSQLAYAANALECGWLCTPTCIADHEPGTPCRHKTTTGSIKPAMCEWAEQCAEPIFYRTRRHIPLTEPLTKLVEMSKQNATAPLIDWIAWECQASGVGKPQSKLWNQYKHLLHEDPDHSHLTPTFLHDEAEEGDLVQQGRELRERREEFLARTRVSFAMRLKFARQDLERFARSHEVHDERGFCCDAKHKRVRVVGRFFIWAEESDDDDDDDEWD